ncbi:MAG TPA: Ig-like domain repeat protein, partial [Gammaproteobacteria bacterium]|nr:Ig-like domain repeat protein [Gammaproteobacteria bacterium]
MKLKILNPKKSKAQAMVEFAIALPVLLALLYGILEAGRLMFMYSTVVNASRQAVRWGSTTGIGNDGTEPRYQDCDGIRAEAQRAAYIGAFNTITLKYDSGPGTSETAYCSAGATTDNTFTPSTNNTSRISVTVEKQFNPIVPNLVPFISRNIRATSSRTILISIDIVVTPPVPPKAATTTLITSDLPDPSNVGQTVSVTVTVTGGSTTPTGTVTITGADVNCTITLSSGGTGSCNVVFNSGGSRLLNASYGGDSKHLASADADGENHYVRYPTTLAITSHNPDPSTTGQAVNVVVSVTSGLPIPNGQTISITGADTNCTITLPATSCNVIFTSTGEKTITATYAGDADHSGGTATAIHDVLINKVTVTRITSDTPDPSELNQPVTVS